MKKSGIILSLFISFLLIISPFSIGEVIYNSKATASDDITGFEEWSEDVIINNYVVVEAGATLVIDPGVKVTFANKWIRLIVEGNLIVKGTVKNPVIITGDNLDDGGFAIVAAPDSNVIMRNAEISGGGSQAVLIGKTNVALASSYRGAIQIEGGKVNIQNTTFRNNRYAIIAPSSDAEIVVNRSRFIDNDYDVEAGANANFKYNWWGSSEGLVPVCYEYKGTQYCYYEKSYGDFDFSDWLTEENFHDPVLIVPGIMGTVEFFGQKILDPILKTYDNLYETLDENGYTPGVDLFEFPYEWRDSNIDNAQLLGDKINEIKQISHWPKVDVVAHSMGGLLAREYIESSYYQDDIDQLVTIGTPHRGSPEDYLAWEGGKITSSKFDFFGMLMEDLLRVEAKEKGFSDIFDYIHNRPITSVQELLSTNDYLFDVSQNQTRTYPSKYPINSFLDSLNAEENVSKLNNVEIDSLVGKLDDSESTISNIRVVESPDSTLWEHGYPEDFDALLGDHGLEYGEGDGTVPLDSADGISADERVEINAKHRNLPSEGADIVYDFLNGSLPTKNIDFTGIKSLLFFSVFSPVDIQIEDPNGRKSGKDFETGNTLEEIPGAFYPGYSGEEEYLTVPEPLDGEYKVRIQGTGDGDYKIRADKISEESGQVEEISSEIFGTAELRKEDEIQLTISPENVSFEEENKDEEAPEVAIASPENKEYLNDSVIAVSYSVSNNVSASENIQSTVSLDGEKLSSLDLDASLLGLGKHRIKVLAKDEAQNEGSAEVEFTLTTDIDAIINNLKHYFDLKLIKSINEEKLLIIKCQEIKSLLGFLEQIKKIPLPERFKQGIIDIQKRIISHEIDEIIWRINLQKKNKSLWDRGAAEILIESLEAVRTV